MRAMEHTTVRVGNRTQDWKSQQAKILGQNESQSADQKVTEGEFCRFKVNYGHVYMFKSKFQVAQANRD